jgi:hypothetical protein
MMTLFFLALVIVILGKLAFVVVVFTGIVVLVRNHEVGSELARKEVKALPLIGLFLLILLAALLTFYFLRPHSWLQWVQLATIVVFGLLYALIPVFIAYTMIIRRRPGSLLLDLGRTDSILLLPMALLFILMGAKVFISNSIVRTPDVTSALAGGIYVLLGLFLFLRSRSRTQVTTRGIYHFGTRILWQHIESFNWTGPEANVFNIRRRHWLPPARAFYFPVPANVRQELEKVFMDRAGSAGSI